MPQPLVFPTPERTNLCSLVTSPCLTYMLSYEGWYGPAACDTSTLECRGVASTMTSGSAVEHLG